MKQAYDKGSAPSPFSVGDSVMLWKPYKKKGISGCFQPKWHGPWVILKFTGKAKRNCTIHECQNPSNKLNVHVNQLKLLKNYIKENKNTTQHIQKQNKNKTQHTQQYTNSSRNIYRHNSNNNSTFRSSGGVDGTDGADSFLHYLDDLDDDGDVAVPAGAAPADAGQLNEIIHQPPQAQALPPRQQIDQRWVGLDPSNIIPGGRTRNNPDYNVLAGNR